eukprot:TRINITY_DN11324_c0_g3_i2.p1 TRINITY_DN11324_c0_g3~~TRINITY_DN11324_c0_g3_i2.p1  ORF type:complete len:1207 (+),score=411.50 TRINITY_DN11324_c0_g3_i2:3-3623(+)
MDERLQRKIVKAVVDLMNDTNGEVQNMAVKCLSHLVNQLEPVLLQELTRTLADKVVKGDDQTRDIHGLGLKTVIGQLPSTAPASAAVFDFLIVTLLQTLDAPEDGRVLECLDLLADILRRYGREASEQHVAIAAAMLPLLDHTRTFVQKKSITCMATLAPLANDELFTQMLTSVLKPVDEVPVGDAKAQTLMWTCAAFSREVGQRLGPFIQTMVPFAVKQMEVEENDELQETCLQVLEALAHNNPAGFAPHLNGTVELAVKALQFDPNYSYDDDDDDMDDDEDDEDGFGDDSDEEEDYSDDDDTTWKVRRSAAKCLSACIVTRPDLLDDFLKTVLPKVVVCFREREENVRVDVFATFETIVKQVQLTSGDNAIAQGGMSVETTSQSLLREALPSVFKHVARQTKDKNMKVRAGLISLLKALARALREAFADCLAVVLDLLEHTLKDDSSTNAKTECLVLLHHILKTHSTAALTDQVVRCADVATHGLQDPFYKITAKSLGVAIDLLPHMRPDITQPLATPVRDSVHRMLTAVFAPLRSTDSDLEVRQRSLACAGEIIALMGDEMADTVPELLAVLMERLENEITRVAAAGAIAAVARSPLSIDLSKVLHPALTAFSKDLKKSSRLLRMSALSTIDVLLSEHSAHVSEAVIDAILVEIPELLQANNDLQLIGLAAEVTHTCGRCNPATWAKITSDIPILSTALKVLASGSLQGDALKSFCQLYAAVSVSGVPDMDQMTTIKALLEGINSGGAGQLRPDGLVYHRSNLVSIGHVIGAVALADSSNVPAIVGNFTTDLNTQGTTPSLKVAALACLGHIGQEYDLSTLPESHAPIIAAFASDNDEVRLTAAESLGSVACGNLDAFVPVVMKEMGRNPDESYLCLQSFKTIISTKTADRTTVQALQPHVEAFWGALLQSSENDVESTRNMVSECLGRLAVVNPAGLVVELQKNLASGSTHARSTTVNAMRYLLNVSTAMDEGAIKPVLQDFLRCVGDGENEVRRAAVLTFNTALQTKPHLVVEGLDEIVQLIYQETDVRQALVREVAMGPFKHQIDDGLDTRKAAYECLFTLTDVCPERVSVPVLLGHVVKGLNDHYDIKLLMFLMVTRVVNKFPSEVLQRMDDFAQALQKTIDKTLKKNAVAQEVEKNDELKRTAVRAVHALAHLPGSEKSASLQKLVDTVRAVPMLMERWTLLQTGGAAAEPGMDMRSD